MPSFHNIKIIINKKTKNIKTTTIIKTNKKIIKKVKNTRTNTTTIKSTKLISKRGFEDKVIRRTTIIKSCANSLETTTKAAMDVQTESATNVFVTITTIKHVN